MLISPITSTTVSTKRRGQDMGRSSDVYARTTRAKLMYVLCYSLSFLVHLLLRPFLYLGSAHRVFNFHILRCCASSMFAPFSLLRVFSCNITPPQYCISVLTHVHILFFRISSSHIVNSVCWSHALVNGPTSKRPASDGGRCSGQLLMMWPAVCSGSPHSHAALSASPDFMDALYRPTPVRSLFRVVQCFRLRSSPLTPSPGSDTWRCTRVGPDASHSCFHVASIHASLNRSSGMTLSIS